MLRPDEISKRPGSFSTNPLSVVQLAGESRDVTRLIIAKRWIFCQILAAGVLGALGWGFAFVVSYSRAPQLAWRIVVVVKRGVHRGILGKRGEEILKAVYFYRYMTALDVCSMLYAPSSLVHVRRILTELSGGGDYVEREFLYRFPLQRGVGNRVRVYTLGARGRDFFKHELEYPVAWYFRPDKVRHLSLGQMMHNLILTRFLVAAKMWAEGRPEFKLLQVRTCYEVGSDYPSVEVVKEGKKERVKVIPDAWLLFETVKDSVEWPILLEIDRGTAFKHKFKDHIASRIEFIKRGGVYSKLFGGEAVVVCYVTTGETKEYREARLRAMCAWAMEVLKEQGRDAWASVFRFGSIGLEDMYEFTLFEKNVWYRPDRPAPVGLFAG